MSLPNPPPTPSISPTMSIVVTQPPQNPSSVLPSLAPTINTTNTTNGSGGNSDGGRSRGASYFFGFLIAFIALLLFFIGCGVGARRRLLNRRRRLHVFFGDINNSGDVPWFAADANASLDGFFGRDNDAKLEDIKEPLFWDRGFSKGGEFWDSMIVRLSVFSFLFSKRLILLLLP
ncbi:hypothetical protein AMATHDRAFT_88828 [Amanita thiersii Skay4041]|uniref:Uncharacterized protein n=1 Tax=Amanita thiersii Skay4041 TaxID=703135 RepID=A0A2A9N8K0_9AGAR|nr:hypothetical protein AMATHDRAFT_88828 [Amanita thiersii Skay4041]